MTILNVCVRVALTGAFTVALAAGSQAASGRCEPTKVKFKTTDTPAITSSTTDILVPSSTARFRQGGSNARCVIVRLSAMAGTAAGEGMIVAAALDGGVQQAEPGFVQLVADKGVPVQRSATFIFSSVAPGKHKVQLYYKSDLGDAVGLYSRVMTVEFQ